MSDRTTQRGRAIVPPTTRQTRSTTAALRLQKRLARTQRGRIQRAALPVSRQTRSTTARLNALEAAANALATAQTDMTATEIPRITGFSTIKDNYQVLLVDLFGTLWDGKTSFPLSLDCMRKSKKAGIKVILLSNTPRPNLNVSEALVAAGIDEECYDMLLTSGEAARTMIARKCEQVSRRQRLFFIGPEKNASVFAGLDVEQVMDPKDADFVLNTGPPTEYRVGEAMPEVDAILTACMAAGLPMVCVNPDLEVKRDGELWVCAGELMKRYTAMKGEVSNYGKPYVEVFETALAGLDVDRSKVLMIGDGALTDMLGAKNFGCHGLWIIGTGIHAVDVGEDEKKIAALAAKHDIAPTAWMQELQW